MPLVSYGVLGQALGAIGEAVSAQGAQGAAAGRYFAAAGSYFEGIEGAIEGESAGHIIAGILGATAAATLWPAGTTSAAMLAVPAVAALPPVMGGLIVAGMIIGGYMLAGELTAETYDVLVSLGDLLADILSDPLVLDLDGDGVELVPLAQSATMFDLDGDGVAERVGWASPHDGLLVQDANGNGVVDGVGELFGSASVDGFDELKTLDANNDGRIDALDPAFADLRVWRDVNSDGVSSSDEILTLAQAGITRFNLAYSQANTPIGGNVIARNGSYVRTDGTSRTMSSIQFGMDESGSLPTITEGAADRLDMAA